MSIKNSNNTIGNRIRDFPACRAVPQPTAPPRSSPTERHYFKSQINLIFLFVISSFPRKKCVCSYIALPTCSFPAYLYPLHDHSSVMFDVITMFVAATNATYTVTSQAPLPNCGYPQPTPPPHPLPTPSRMDVPSASSVTTVCKPTPPPVDSCIIQYY